MPMFRNLRSNLGTAWCTLMHDAVMWPVHGAYECRTCGRHYPAFRETPGARWSKPAALKAVVSLVVLLMIASAGRMAHAADLARDLGRSDAEANLERYVGGGGVPAWTFESVEVHASLPDLTKSGWLQATRRVTPGGAVRYEIAQLTGDRTVKDQVIARYLTAEERASQTPAASVAISPANYKFAYKGIVDDGERYAYVFRIAPRKKRTGLIKGELWLDVETGVPIRRSGYLVRSPSMWIRRVAVTQDDLLRDGRIASRLTHITVDTRLVGRAELVIAERPLGGGEGRQVTNVESNGGQQ
jgi:hypothetical protein